MSRQLDLFHDLDDSAARVEPYVVLDQFGFIYQTSFASGVDAQVALDLGSCVVHHVDAFYVCWLDQRWAYHVG